MQIVPIPSREQLGLAETDSPTFTGIGLGDQDTNGSYRLIVVSGELELQKRESDSWVYKARF